jgi:DNA-binding CsgD family transcriptional regulator/tetratricopeptide (TPR) repeat protein
MRLLEREDIVRKLDGYVTDLVGGLGSLVCLSGEAGIGKTTLVQVVVERAERRARVLWGACEDLSTPAPLAPLQDFAREGSWKLSTADQYPNQLAFFETAFEQLTNEPTVAVMEDLHWADDATLDFVRFVARRLRKVPLLVLITARDDSSEAQARLRRLLADVPPDKYERIELFGLTEATVRRIASDHGRDGAAVYALTSGNPFLTMELLKQESDCPASVSDTLLWRADKLSPMARTALDAASIFPRRVECLVLEEMCGVGAHGVPECVASGLLQVEKGFYRFRHEIARRAIEGALSYVERERLNQRALEILKPDKTVTAARLAHHAIEANDAAAVSIFAPLAATEAGDSGAHREAVKHLRAALEYAGAWGSSKRAALLEQLGYELQLTGEVNAAIEVFGAALELRQQCDDQLRAGDDLRWMSRLNYNAGKPQQGFQIGRRAVDVLEPLGESYELAMAYANLALASALRDDGAGAIELATKASLLAEKLGHTELLADTHGTLGIANQWLDMASSRRHFQQALALALDCHRPELVARIYLNGGGVELNARANENARGWLEAGIRYCDERDLAWAIYMKGLLAELLAREGRWHDAEALADEALRDAKTPVQRFPSTVVLARLHIRCGVEASELFADLSLYAEPQRLMIYAPLVGERAWLLKFEVGESLEVMKKAGEVAAAIGNFWAAGEIEYWRAKLEATRPSPDVKVAPPYARLFAGSWAAAAEVWKEMEAPYERALALLHGDEAACGEALGILDGLGAKATASRVRRELRARGLRGLPRGPRESTQSNRAGLTRREMGVLRLLEAGMSNAEIAARLNIAPKTVDHHVSAILAKLESSSRLEAVNEARKLRLFDDENQSST